MHYVEACRLVSGGPLAALCPSVAGRRPTLTGYLDDPKVEEAYATHFVWPATKDASS